MEARSHSLPSSIAEESAAIHLRVFAVLLAIGVLFHNVTTMALEFVSWDSVLTLAAFWILARPSSFRRLLILSAVLLVDIALDAPDIANHKFLAGVFALAVLTCFAVEAHGRRFSVTRFHAGLAPIIRSATVLMYLLAALAKVNRDYLNPDLSAAVTHIFSVARWLPIPQDDWIKMPAIYLVLAVECMLPVLLVWRRTRLFGAIMALVFHVVMALAGYVPFSAFAPCFLLFFLPDGFPRWLVGLHRRTETAFGPLLSSSRWILLTGAFLAWATISSKLTWGSLSWNQVAGHLYPACPLGTILFLVYSVGLLVIMRMYVGDVRRLQPAHGRVFRMSRLPYIVFPLLVLANGMSPYVGLKTMYSFSMFSNLQTEGDQWNHILIPESVRVFDCQDDLVRIIESSDPVLARSARDGERWVHLQFLDYVSERPDIAVTYEHKGRIERVARVGNHPQLSQRPNVLVRKMSSFRPVFPPERNTGTRKLR